MLSPTLSRFSAIALSGLALMALSANPADASPANVELTSVTQEGDLFRFSYNLSLASTESLMTSDFFTIYDFNGFAGGLTGPAGFTGSSSAFGPNAPAVIVSESAVPNVTFTYSGPTLTGGTISGFSALSANGPGIMSGQFSAETSDATGPIRGSISSIGPAAVPTAQTNAIPEPGTAALLGIGLLGGIATVAGRRKKSA